MFDLEEQNNGRSIGCFFEWTINNKKSKRKQKRKSESNENSSKKRKSEPETSTNIPPVSSEEQQTNINFQSKTKPFSESVFIKEENLGIEQPSDVQVPSLILDTAAVQKQIQQSINNDFMKMYKL